ncbi:uncharacterized protein V1513DRAFT_378097 [Lipomyces chichibuensis]|uniref:uncharacterized protein n=1 Tax=Lipomyces chichibuensis TaxID=1546026 RepID=UPI0033431892
MNNNKRVPYGGAIGIRSSSSMDFHSHNNMAVPGAAAAAVLPRSSSAISLSSAAAAAALKRANSQDSAHSVMVPSKRAEQRASIGLERRSSMSERVLRSQSVGPQRRRLRHNNGEASQLSKLWTNSATSTSSLPRTLRSSGGRRPSSSGYASSIRSYESDLNSISEDRTLDSSSILSSPKMIASKSVPPAITEELLSPPVKHAPPSRTLSPSKSAMKDTSRPSSVVSSRSDTEEMMHLSKKKHVRISFSGATPTPPPAMPLSPTARGPNKLAHDICNNTGERKPEEANAVVPRNGVDGVAQKIKVKAAATTAVNSSTDEIMGATAVQQIVTSAHYVKDNEHKDSDSEGSIYEDASDIIELDRDEFPNLLAVVNVITGETSQTHGDAASEEIVDKVPSQAQSAPKFQPPAETVTRQQAGSTPSRKPVGLPLSIPFARMGTSRPSTDAESESREKSQNPTLQHPTPRAAKPLNAILKASSPDLSRTSSSDHHARGNHRSLPNSYSGRSFASLRSSNSPPPFPSVDAATELDSARKYGGSSSSSFRRNTVGGSQPTSGMKSSLRHILPAEERSKLPRFESTTSKPAFQSNMNHRRLHHNQPSQPATTRPSTQPSSFGVSFGQLRRSDSGSSFQREGGYESDSQAFGFKKFSSLRDQSSQVDKGPQGRITILDSDSEGESAAYNRRSISRPHGVASGTPRTGTFADTFKSHLVDSDSEDEPAVAAPAPIIRKHFPSSHPFSYEPVTATDTSEDIPGEPDYSYDDATAGVAISDDVLPPAPPAVESTVSAPTTPVKHRKLSQYQQHKLAKQQKKDERERLKRVQETRNYGPNNINTAIGPIANINSVPMPQPRKKKFGSLRKFFGLDH